MSPCKMIIFHIIDILKTYKTLHISTCTRHFIASFFFYEFLFAFVAFADEGFCHAFFNEVFCGEFVLGLKF